MRTMLLLSTLLIGAAPFASNAAPVMPRLGIDTAVQTVREAGEGPRREDRRQDRRNDRRHSATEGHSGIILAREASEGSRREDRRQDRRQDRRNDRRHGLILDGGSLA